MKDEKEFYYIRNEGYVGNALCWWAENSRGYTSDIRKAGKYTKEQAEQICKRDEDSAYKCSDIDNLEVSHKLIIDAQYIHLAKEYFKK